MPLTRGTAYVTATEVAEITHEAGLDRLDEGSATIANACTRATDYAIDDLKALGKIVDPALISNTGDLKVALARMAAWICLSAQPDPESQARAARHLELYEKQIAKFQFESTVAGDEQFIGHAVPRTFHLDAAPTFARGVDNRHPRGDPSRTWIEK